MQVTFGEVSKIKLDADGPDFIRNINVLDDNGSTHEFTQKAMFDAGVIILSADGYCAVNGNWEKWGIDSRPMTEDEIAILKAVRQHPNFRKWDI